MGVSGLMNLIKKKAPDAIEDVITDVLHGKRVAVDVSIWINQFVCMMSVDGEIPCEEVVRGILKRMKAMTDAGIIPIFVFDGTAPLCKQREIERRRDINSRIRAKAETTLDNSHERSRLLRQSTRPTQQLIQQVKDALHESKVMVIDAPGEAEAQCADLCLRYNVWGVISEDTDTLTFGAPRLIRNYNNEACRTDSLTLVRLDKILESFKMTHAQFVDLCILCGCDFTQKLKGIGPMKAFKLIQQHETIEEVVAALQNIKSQKGDSLNVENFDHEVARTTFLKPCVSTVIYDVDQLSCEDIYHIPEPEMAFSGARKRKFSEQ